MADVALCVRQVCPALRLCPLPASLSSPESSEEELQRDGDGPGCAICEYAMNTLLDFLKDKKTEVGTSFSLPCLPAPLAPPSVTGRGTGRPGPPAAVALDRAPALT